MKNSIALVAFLLIAGSSSPFFTNALKIPRSARVQSGACPMSFTGLIPDPEDCHSFYNCNSGIPGKIPCPSGLCFNPTGPGTGQCEYCELVPGCEDAVTETASPSTSTEVPSSSSSAPSSSTGVPPSSSSSDPSSSTSAPPSSSSSAPSSSTSGSSSEPSSSTSAPSSSTSGPSSSTEPPRSSTEPIGDLRCPSDTPYIYLPYPGDCNKFYYCVDGTNAGSWNCGEGLWFHFEQQACNFPWGAICQQ